ncbi:helicase [Bifidobacterium avesanii]|uniref:Helicase n=1 Tax=Bifidobacterium avesanii TaxID=1798157 RepID=A0A7K3TH21_9BIFI|nr:helicase [Bifidobacterium avesanii]KAB8295549.1 helicase [Bifidobacterium avesanii]NEG77553.1 helicase [Bifidobacterium avesanii]
MAEERNHGSHQGGYKPRRSGGGFGGPRGGNGGRGGYRGQGGSGRSGGFNRGGKPRFHRDGEFDRDRKPREGGEQGGFRDREGGFKGGDRPFRKGGQGGFHRGGNGGGFRRDLHKDGEDRGGFRRGGNGGPRFRRDDRRDDRRNWRDRNDGDQRPQNAGEGTGEGGERRDFHRGNGGFNRGDQGGFRRGNGGFRRGGNPRYGRGDGDDRRGGFRRDGENAGERGDRRDGFRKDFHKDRDFRKDRDFQRDGEDRGGFRKDRGERRDFHREDRGERKDFRRDDKPRFDRNDRSRGHYDDEGNFHENRRGGQHWDKARRNSDGTMSFPSQNPYTDARPGEPKMPKGMEWNMLSKDERERLRGLSKEHAENIGLHILAAYALEESDPKWALEHAKWAARQASRIDFARETLAFVAYRQGDYKTAVKEFRTAFRMNGYLDYLPFIADCERGLGNPKKAVEIATGDEAKQLRGEAKAEMFLVYAGALSDLGLWSKAVEIADTVARSKGVSGEYRMRAFQAEQYFLEQDGKADEAAKLDDVLDRLEGQYAEEDIDPDSDDVVIDHDLADFTDDQLDMLGISEDEAQYAPSDDDDSDEDASDEAGGDDEAEADDDAEGPVESKIEREDDAAEGEAEIAADAAKAEADDVDNTDAGSGDDEEAVSAETAEEGASSDAEPAETAEAESSESSESSEAE